MSFDEQPDGDIHGECAFEIHSLQQQLASCQAALADTEALEIGTGERLAKVEQQLSAAIAAYKLKDEELEKIRGHIGLYNLFSCVGSDSYDPECADLNVGKCGEIATKALAIQPDDSALKAWLGEPADWKFTTSSGTYYTDDKRDWLDGYGIESVTPLYSPKGLK